jgi:hypothetical protein
VNLPFKTNVKYPLKGPKQESRPQNSTLHSSSDLQANGYNSIDMVSSASNSRNSLDFPSPPLDEALSQKNWKKQRQIVRELIETERRYFELLNKIQTNYILPIQASHQTNDYQVRRPPNFTQVKAMRMKKN